MHDASVGPRLRVAAEARPVDGAVQRVDEQRQVTEKRADANNSIALVVSNAATPLSSLGSQGTRFRGYSEQMITFQPPEGWRDQPVKRIFDVCGAVILISASLPFVLAIVALMAFSGGPVFYKQRRVGRFGKIFKCYKFRTMVPHADQVLKDLLERDASARAEWQRDHKLRDDPRITAVGRFLRRTSLDELPQLLNVLRGQMSLVGPRPVVKEELLRYGSNVTAYLSAMPGITGLWQVSGRNNTDYRRRVALDVYYVRNQCLLLDLYILLKTTRVILGGDGAY